MDSLRPRSSERNTDKDGRSGTNRSKYSGRSGENRKEDSDSKDYEGESSGYSEEQDHEKYSSEEDDSLRRKRDPEDHSDNSRRGHHSSPSHSEEEDEKKEVSKEEENKEENKEEEKKEDEDLKEIEEVERQPLIAKSIVYARERSYCLPHRERAILEQEVMDLPEKTEIIMEKDRNQIDSNSKDLLRKLQNDGIYKIGTTEGIVTPTLTRPIDLSLRQPYRTRVRSAILCERINSLKSKHYKLEIILGKIILRDHKFFIKEDRVAIELKELHDEFERVAGLGMIPFYKGRLHELEKDVQKAEEAKKVDTAQIKFLKASIKDIRRKRNEEKKKVKKLGIQLYEKWIELKKIRKDQDFQSTTVELKAREYDLPGRKNEIIFYLNNIEQQDKTISGKSMPSKELSRRNKIKNLKAKIDVIINGN